MKRTIASFALALVLLLGGCAPKNSWVEKEEGIYYYNDAGTAVTGWQEVDGLLRYFGEDGRLCVGWQTLDSEVYCFGNDGVPVTGWVQRDGVSCYLMENGTLARGWVEEDGVTRYFRENGTLATGWLEEENGRYYLDENGCPAVGETTIDGAEYFFAEDGRLYTGWRGNQYYLPDGTLARGKTDIQGVTYRFREDGTLVTGWLEEGEYRYYFLEDGTPARGAVEIEGQTYHFTPEGIQIWLVNPWNPLPEDYEVTLVPAANGYKIADSCAEALEKMLEDCVQAGIYPVLCSGYRSYWDQYAMYQDKIRELGSVERAKTIVAVPNTSEHQLGLAVDIVSTFNKTLNSSQATTDVQKWLMAHCWDYGFILRYPEESSDITGIIYEPWHYRYVGVPVAKAMQENGLTLEEYLGVA